MRLSYWTLESEFTPIQQCDLFKKIFTQFLIRYFLLNISLYIGPIINYIDIAKSLIEHEDIFIFVCSGHVIAQPTISYSYCNLWQYLLGISGVDLRRQKALTCIVGSLSRVSIGPIAKGWEGRQSRHAEGSAFHVPSPSHQARTSPLLSLRWLIMETERSLDASQRQGGNSPGEAMGGGWGGAIGREHDQSHLRLRSLLMATVHPSNLFAAGSLTTHSLQTRRTLVMSSTHAAEDKLLGNRPKGKTQMTRRSSSGSLASSLFRRRSFWVIRRLWKRQIKDFLSELRSNDA